MWAQGRFCSYINIFPEKEKKKEQKNGKVHGISQTYARIEACILSVIWLFYSRRNRQNQIHQNTSWYKISKIKGNAMWIYRHKKTSFMKFLSIIDTVILKLLWISDNKNGWTLGKIEYSSSVLAIVLQRNRTNII
jgi:hypothetical protein